MIELPHHPSGLDRAVWTDADFAAMGWHDCRVHAVGVAEYEDDTLPPARLLLDLDYIVRWVDPDPDFTFWRAPATLVFHQAWAITGELGPLQELMEIKDIHRYDPPDGVPDPEWQIEGQNFELRLRSRGFTQHLRSAPRLGRRQYLTSAERGGVSFGDGL